MSAAYQSLQTPTPSRKPRRHAESQSGCRAVAAATGVSADELGKMALEGIESTWLDASDRAALARDFEAILSEL